MKLLILLSLVFTVSCAADKRETHYGKTTVPELITIKGEPLKEEVIPVEGGKILIYSDNQKYQIKHDVVTHSYRNPKIEESTLIYWQHAFKDCDVVNVVVTEKIQGHESPEMLLKCDALGTGVVYLERSDVVLRVIEYEKK